MNRCRPSARFVLVALLGLTLPVRGASFILPSSDSDAGKPAAVAANASYVAIGRPANATVDVYNAVTGALIRSHSVGTPADEYGRAVALRGKELVVGAPGINGGNGAIFIQDLFTGAILRSITYTGAGRFGYSIACEGDEMIIGAPSDVDGVLGGFNRGKAYRINLAIGKPTSSILLTILLPSDPQNDAFFGQSVAIHGDIVAVGAPFFDQAAPPLSNVGKVYVYDAKADPLPNPAVTEVSSYMNAAPASGDNFGWALGITPTHLFASAPFSGASEGNVRQINLRTGATQSLALGGPGSLFGFSIAATENMVIIGSPGANSTVGMTSLYQAPNAVNGVTQLAMMDPPVFAVGQRYGQGVALSGNRAVASIVGPFIDGDFTELRDTTGLAPNGLADIRLQQEMAVGSSVGAGSSVVTEITQVGITPFTGAGLGQALPIAKFNTKQMSLVANRLGTRGPINAGVKISDPVSNADETAGAAGSLFTSGSDSIFLIADLASTNLSSILARTGMFINAEISYKNFQTPRNASQGAVDQYFGIPATSKTTTGSLVPVTAATDSGIVVTSVNGTLIRVLREGAAGGYGTIGQVAPRLAFEKRNMIFASSIQGTTTAKDTCLQSYDAVTDALVGVAQEDDTATGAAPARFSAFVGETANGFDSHQEYLFRATLRNCPASTNEGLFTNRNSAPNAPLVWRKGDPVPGTAGAKITRFLRYWIDSSGNVGVHAALSGAGVTPANDGILFRTDLSGTTRILLREGSQAPGTNGSKIGVIQFVDARVNANAWAALVTLVNQPGSATAADTLALYTGTAQVRPFDQPELALRKGTRVNQPTAEIIKSIALASKVTEGTSGALGVGMGHVVAPDQKVATILTYTDGLKTSTVVRP